MLSLPGPAPARREQPHALACGGGAGAAVGGARLTAVAEEVHLVALGLQASLINQLLHSVEVPGAAGVGSQEGWERT